MPRPLLPLFVALGLTLAACGTPQEQCVNRATRDLRVVDRLITQMKTDIARGYSYETHQFTVTRWVPCGSPYLRRTRHGDYLTAPRMCLDDVTRTAQRPVAIDLAETKRKLVQLVDKRRQLDQQAGRDITTCKATYPE